MIFGAVAGLDIKRDVLQALADLDSVQQVRLRAPKSGGGPGVEFLGAPVRFPKDSSGATAELSISGERVHMLTDTATLKAAMASIARKQELASRPNFARSPVRARF